MHDIKVHMIGSAILHTITNCFALGLIVNSYLLYLIEFRVCFLII